MFARDADGTAVRRCVKQHEAKETSMAAKKPGKRKTAAQSGRHAEDFDSSVLTTEDDVRQSTLTTGRARELRKRAAKMRERLTPA
jgi:hypothetical protein